mmetsp:Transcript_27033/g.46608  ORF Transcript_27033/g.46608 Transcript_27033/m.46608 type:complete len:382 (+) Transcript_27033:453-1598(+)
MLTRRAVQKLFTIRKLLNVRYILLGTDTSFETKQLLELIVKDEHHGTARASNGVGQGTLEESPRALFRRDFHPAVQGILVKNVLATRLHHHASSHSIKRIGGNTGQRGNNLSDHPRLPERSILRILQKDCFGGIVATEEGGTVDDNANNRDTKALIEALGTILFVDLLQTITKTSKLPVSPFADISTQPRTGEVEGIHEHEGCGTSSTTGSQVLHEEQPEVGFRIMPNEDLFVLILKSEIKGLSWEVSDNICQVSSPERHEALLLGNACEGIDDALVLFVGSDLGGSSLNLKKELHTLDRGDDGFGNTTSNTTSQQILHEGDHGAIGFLLCRSDRESVGREGSCVHAAREGYSLADIIRCSHVDFGERPWTAGSTSVDFWW